MRIKYIVSKDKRVSGFNDLIINKFPSFIDEKDPELLLVAGGDGAMLHSIQKYHNLELPFFGKALGTVNFLLNRIENDEKTLHDISNGKISLYYFMFQSIEVLVDHKHLTYSVNEVLLGDSINAYHKFQINCNDKSFKNFNISGTGLVISTTLGSTAYSYNNGGSILPLNSNLWFVSGVVTNRYLSDIVSQQEFEIGIDKGDIYSDGIKVFSSKDRFLVTLKPGKAIKLGFLNNESLYSKRIDFANRLRIVNQ